MPETPIPLCSSTVYHPSCKIVARRLTSRLGENAAQKFIRGCTVEKVSFWDMSNANLLASARNFSFSCIVSRFHQDTNRDVYPGYSLHPSEKNVKSTRLLEGPDTTKGCTSNPGLVNGRVDEKVCWSGLII